MMYSASKHLILRLFRVDPSPPEAPRGSHASVRVMRASPKYFRYSVLALVGSAVALFGVLIVVAIALAFSDEPAATLVPLALAAVFLPIFATRYFCARVDYELRYYVLTDKSVRVRGGAWVVDEQTISYANVQNVRVVQGPLQRLFGIANVHIDTAGGGASSEAGHQVAKGHGVVIAGVENSAEIRDAILEHLRRHAADSGLGDPDDASDRRSSVSPEALAALREVVAQARGLRLAAEHGR